MISRLGVLTALPANLHVSSYATVAMISLEHPGRYRGIVVLPCRAEFNTRFVLVCADIGIDEIEVGCKYEKRSESKEREGDKGKKGGGKEGRSQARAPLAKAVQYLKATCQPMADSTQRASIVCRELNVPMFGSVWCFMNGLIHHVLFQSRWNVSRTRFLDRVLTPLTLARTTFVSQHFSCF